MAQSFFVSKSIGVDYGNSEIDSRAFKNSLFYIDTNVAIPVLEPSQRLHDSFRLIQSFTSSIDSRFKICTNTLDELDGWADDRYGKVKDALQSLPSKVFEKSSSVFANIYKRKKKKEENVDIDDLFEVFNNAEDILEDKYNIEREYEGWFVEDSRNDKRTEKIIKRVRQASERKRNKDKHPSQASHDALLFRWVEYQREQGYNAWVLTADTSLPAVDIPDYDGKPLVITMDSLLQWLSPTVSSEDDQEKFREVFSSLIRERILPQDKLFKLDHFQVFNDLEVSVKEMPEDDVERCVRMIENKSGNYDLDDAADREDFMHEIKSFLVSNDRVYKKKLRRKENEASKAKHRANELEEDVEKLERDVKEIKELLNEEREEREKVERERLLERQAYSRALFLSLGLIVSISIVLYMSYNYGSQNVNAFQSLNKWSGLLSFVVAFHFGIAPFIISKEHLLAAGIFQRSE